MRNPAVKPIAWGGGAAALACALAGAAVFQFFGSAAHGYLKTSSLFWWWISQWIDPQAETEHGWLILGIAAWLLWKGLGTRGEGREGRGERETTEDGAGASVAAGTPLPASRLLPLASDSDSASGRSPLASRLNSGPWPAAVAMVLALALHAVGFAAQQARISIVALLLFTWGVARLGGGRRWGSAAAFPLAFLVFAIPVNVLDSLGFWLRLGVIRASTAMAHGVGIGVIQSGTQLMAPDGRYNYDVAAACSGVRSLMALAALSLLIGYLNFASWWRRGLMLLLCFPLVYLGNVARIVAIVFAAQGGGPRWGDFAHATMGYAIFVIVLGGVLGAAEILRRVAPEPCRAGSPHPAVANLASADDGRDDGGVRRPRPTALVGAFATGWCAALVVVFALGEMLFLHHLAGLPARGEVGVVLAADGQNPVELPALLGRDWVGWPAPVTAIERAVLPPDTGYSRMSYVSSRAEPPVFLSIVLSGRDRTSIHRPELCLVGQGWTIDGQASHAFAFPAHPETVFDATVLRVRRQMTTARGTTVVPQVVVYWFVGGDQVVATHWQRFLVDAWNRVVHARADRWAYVLLQTDAADGEAAALARVQAVLNATLPAFQRPLGGPGPRR